MDSHDTTRDRIPLRRGEDEATLLSTHALKIPVFVIDYMQLSIVNNRPSELIHVVTPLCLKSTFLCS